MELTLDRVLGIVGVLGIFIGVGVAMAMDPKVRGEAVFASGCFIVSGLALCLTIGFWAFGTAVSTPVRIAITAVLCASVCVAMVEAIRWSDRRYQRAVAGEKVPEQTASELPPQPVPPVMTPTKPHTGHKIEPTASLEMGIVPSIDMGAGRLYVDLTIVNVGQLAARKIVRLHSAAIGHIIQPEDEAKTKAAVDARWAVFEAANKKEPLGVNDIGIGQNGAWRFDDSDFHFEKPVTKDLLKEIQEGRSTLFFFIALKYMDDLHPLLESTGCIAYSKGFAVQCHGHNTMPL
jgi:hypothetical protein